MNPKTVFEPFFNTRYNPMGPKKALNPNYKIRLRLKFALNVYLDLNQFHYNLILT